MTALRDGVLGAVLGLVLGAWTTTVSAAPAAPLAHGAWVATLSAGAIQDDDDFLDDADDDDAFGDDEADDSAFDDDTPPEDEGADAAGDEDEAGGGERPEAGQEADQSFDEQDYGADAGVENADYADDSWAPAIDDNPADDAIPFDDSTWGEDAEFEVAEVANDADGADGGGDAEGDSTGMGSMLVLRSAGRSGGARSGGAGAKDGGEDVPYAYGGRPVIAAAVPWQAQIFNPKVEPDPKNPRPIWQRSHYCGGALIARDWVLTAAHCIDQQLVDYGFKVRLGVSDISKGDGITYRIQRIVRHSRYLDKVEGVPAPLNPPNMYFDDIALIQIAEDGAPKRRDPQKIREIPINRTSLAGGTPVSVTGWGAVGTGDTQTASAALLRVDLRLMDTPVCQKRPKFGPRKIHDRVFCAAHPTRSTCRGDSGGPVVLTNGPPVLVGVVSWGKSECAGDGRPGVYTRIDKYLAWIEQAMKLPPDRNALP